MKKTLFPLFLCIALVLPVSAQKALDNIRKEYQDVQEMIALMMPNEDGIVAWPPDYFDLQVQQNLPATGPHKENIRMFYGKLEPEEEGDPYPPHYLRFTTAKYNFAAREYYEEYLYNDKGQVIFIYAITPDIDDNMAPYELRLYFDGNRLVRFTAKKTDAKGYLDIAFLRKATFKEVYSGKTIPEKFLDETDRCKQRAHRFLTMFKGIDDNTYL